MRYAVVVSTSALALAGLVGCGRGEPKTPLSVVAGMPGESESTSSPRRETTKSDAEQPAKAKGGEAVADKKGEPPPPAAPQTPQQQPPPAPSGTNKSELPADIAKNRDLVIYTAKFTMAVYQVDQGLGAVEKIANDNGGYLGTKRDREITVRVPRGRFEMTLAAIDKLGDVLHRDIQAEDVTDEHVDLEIRIKNARAMQRRLADLLTKADVKNALEIEKELHRITEELERLEGKMKVLKDRVAYSTITVTFEPRGATLTASRPRLPFPWLGNLNLPNLLSLTEER